MTKCDRVGRTSRGRGRTGISSRCSNDLLLIADVSGRKSRIARDRFLREFRTSKITEGDFREMTMETLSLGFDLRLRAEDYAREVWSPEHRGSYLLREDVDWPMSVDRSVWPSFLQSHYFDSRARRISNSRFVNQDTSTLENDFGMLRDVKSLVQLPVAQLGVGIGVQVIWQQREKIKPLLGIEASAIPHGAAVLGFDVATATPISGLSNCGYDQNELPQLRFRWGSKLNEHGLLKSLDDAVQFREMTNRRVPEHAPFHVYKLFQIALKKQIE